MQCGLHTGIQQLCDGVPKAAREGSRALAVQEAQVAGKGWLQAAVVEQQAARYKHRKTQARLQLKSTGQQYKYTGTASRAAVLGRPGPSYLVQPSGFLGL